MDGRWVTVIGFLIVPTILIGLTVVEFATNPIAILILLAMMLAGGMYLVSYTSTFAGSDSST
jgi:hypothetical protein